jgi:hypothetical protein
MLALKEQSAKKGFCFIVKNAKDVTPNVFGRVL